MKLILFLVLQISVFCVYRVPGRSFEPYIKRRSVVLVNKLAYGLHVPFFKETLIEWNLPKKGDIIVIKTKNNKNLLKRVVGLPREELNILGKRFVVPDGFILVGTGNSLNDSDVDRKNFGLVSIKNVLGKYIH